MPAHKARVSRKTVPTRTKVDPHLNFLMNVGLEAIRRQVKAERKARLDSQARIDDVTSEFHNAKDEKTRVRLHKEISDLIDRTPVSLAHGVYFPDDRELMRDAPIRLRTPYVSAFIKGQFSAEDLAKFGVRVRSYLGGLCTAFVPWTLIERLRAMPGIEFIELARPLVYTLNNSLPYSQISNLQGAPTNLTGAGVVVGVADTFLHFYHPDFRNNDGAGGDGQGSTRVLFLWDQLLVPQGAEAGPPALPGFPAGWATYGVEYSQANVNAELNNFGPPPAAGQPPTNNAYQIVRHAAGVANVNNAHGTHVAGIAAGNGRAQGGTFVGAAPGAGVIFVRNGSNNFIHGDSTVVADAFNYIFARAAGQPCVVNMSQSDNMGPHDGTTLGEQFIDALLATPGRALTLAAGNANNEGTHTRGVVPAGGTATPAVNYANDAFGNAPVNNDVIQIWYDGHDNFNVSLTIPSAPVTVIGPIGPGATSALTNLPNGVQVQVQHTQNDPRNGDNVITVFINNVAAARPIPLGAWQIQLAGTVVINGAFEGWVDRNNRSNRSWAVPVESDATIAVPATSVRAVSVGNHDRAGPPPNIAGSSSCGPTRDGRVKPDISAVGTNVTAPWYQLMNNANPGVAYFAISGTSMAAPMVAGTIALMFQCRGGGLTWSDVKQLLQDNAAVPAAGIPTNTFGFGFLQAANLCAAPVPAVDVWLRDHVNDTGVEPFTGGITWLSPDIEVLDLAGNPVSNPTHDPANFVNNIVRVTVRNRGTLVARNVEVHLYWGDPATNIPFPTEWQATGIYTGDPNFVVQSNKIVIQQLAPGVSAQVRFAWAPPAPGSNLRGDDHFCLIVRLEHEDDPSNVGAGGWTVIGGRNNVALRNTHVQALAGGAGDAETAFYVVGTAEEADAIEVETEKLEGTVELHLPIGALPWWDLNRINRFGHARTPFGAACGTDPLAEMKVDLRSKDVERLTGVTGARRLRVGGGSAILISAAGDRMTIPQVKLRAGANMPARLVVRKAKIGRAHGFVHVRQRSAGRIVGGVSLELAHSVQNGKRLRSRLVEGKLVVE